MILKQSLYYLKILIKKSGKKVNLKDNKSITYLTTQETKTI